jgi:hypothetical protein
MRLVIAALLWLLAVPAFAEDKAEPISPPQWYLDDIRNLAADGGRWIADNSAYMNEQEPYEAYGVEWVSGFDGATMSGRLFGVKDGKETVNFWEFRQYWRPDIKQAVVEQFGWGGAVGIGTLAADGEGTTSDQTFYNSDGSATRTGHKSSYPDNNTHVTDSFDIVDGKWNPRRSYTWIRKAPEKTETK